MLFDQHFDAWSVITVVALSFLCAWRVWLGAAGLLYVCLQTHPLWFVGMNADSLVLWTWGVAAVLVCAETLLMVRAEKEVHDEAERFVDGSVERDAERDAERNEQSRFQSLPHVMDYAGYLVAFAGSYALLPSFTMVVSIILALVVSIPCVFAGARVQRCLMRSDERHRSHGKREILRTLTACVLLAGSLLMPLVTLAGMASWAVLRCKAKPYDTEHHASA